VRSEVGINQLSHATGAVRLFLVQDTNFRRNQDFQKFKKDVCQSEPADLVP